MTGSDLLGVVPGAFAFAVVAAILLKNRAARRAALWGAPLGVLYGFAFVAPELLRAHHLQPESLAQWLWLSAVLTFGFAGLGLVLGAAPAALFGVLTRIPGRLRPSADVTTAAWWTSAGLPPVYVGVSAFIEWVNFARPPAVDARTVEIVAGAAGCTFSVALLAWAFRRRRPFAGGVRAGGLVLTVMLLAMLALPLRHDARDRPAPVAAPPLRQSVADVPPLLFIGLDGGDWRVLRPLVEQGRAPHLARLLQRGMHGTVHARWPPYWSTPAWGAILTGHDRDAIGVHEDLAATAPGMPTFELPLTLNLLLNPVFVPELALIGGNVIEPMPAPRGRLGKTPIWERLSKAGRRTAVIRLPFTHPADGQADYVISNRTVTDLWDVLSVETATAGLVEPSSKSGELLAWFSKRRRIDPALGSTLFGRPGWPKPGDAIVNPEEVLMRVVDTSERMIGVTRAIVAGDPDLDVVMLHVTSLDNVLHAFWQYRFPGDFPDRPPDARDVEVLGPVVDRYAIYLDQRIGELIAAFPQPPNVIVVSDHGAAASRDYPLWRGWHGPEGIFVAAGPGVPPRAEPVSVDYLDVAPTILDLQGFAAAPDLSGRSVIGRGGPR